MKVVLFLSVRNNPHTRSTLRFLALFTLAALILPVSTGKQDGGDIVNAVTGNRFAPGVHESELIRIRTHLLGVARQLARVDSREMSPEMRVAREQNLTHLVAYARAGRFPHNPAGIPGRAPNFMDDSGAVCAVGYLLEQDQGRAAVVEITREYQFDYVPYINSPVLARWQATSGLTPAELAMIQPSYRGDDDYTDDDDGLSKEDVLVISLMAADVVSSVINLTYLTNGKGSRVWAGIGLFVGAFSIIHNQEREDPAGYLTATGVVAAALGATSFGVTLGSGDEHHVTLGPALFGGSGRTAGMGLQARLCF
jgi:hypothetical protein